MSLFSLGLSGLNAAQAGLTVTGHNIDNSGTDGYNRQKVMTSTAGATATGSGYYGRGVMVDTVQRQYSGFLYNQLVQAQSTGAATSSLLTQLTQVDNMLGDNTTGISPALNDFFTSLNAVASSPADAATRQDLIGKAQSLVSQINSAYADLQTQRTGLNTQISSSVDQVNSYLSQINNLNQQIVAAVSNGAGNAPNDLMDQRDSLVQQLGQVVGIRTSTASNGYAVDIALSSGQSLLSGTTVYKLQAVASAADPSRTVVAYTVPSGPGGATTTVEMKDSAITQGSLGGLLQFRSQSLDTLQNKLGQMSVGLATAFNALQAQGVDLNGDAGEDFFSLGTPSALPNAKNTGSATMTADYTDASALTANDYTISYTGGNYTVTRSDGTQVYTGDGTTPPMAFDGLSMNISGVPADGDKWVLSPTRDAAGQIAVAITDPSKIAASDSTNPGSANGNNALAMAQLQTSKTLAGGTLSVTDAFSQIVNTVGQQTAAAKANDTAQQSVISQRQTDQQSVSGVNLNEEYVSLSMFQQQYQAAAKIIDVANTVFQALLGIQ
ncbi:flagellar hook-associated protein FlgK [Bordetella genomosp. 10]|uniref:Flagellar hook-associated protein 1 n=1 Tax=Bordetella genomosp. 10 TaxID=1416804 RepID=A0A261RXU5_9BORD|nr:flagellar hook-associated protein FlgK [Bordetella genomosp. 10]OZI29711.1 flagellar hook-associated protein FlgK [Bordetella genomosp. 10]